MGGFVQAGIAQQYSGAFRSTPFEEFCGLSYELNNKYAGVERTVNWYPYVNEALEEHKFRMAMDSSPSNAAFCQLPVPAPFNQPNRGLLEYRGVAFGVNGNTVFSIDQNGNFSKIGLVANDGGPCSMVANANNQIFISSAGQGYIIQGHAITAPGTGFMGASFATFQDGYIIVVTPNTNQFQISGSQDVPLGDATQWDPGNVAVLAGQADLLASAFSTREYLFLFGQKRTEVWYDAGPQSIGAFPFASYNETFIETGTAAPYSLSDLKDSLFWVGQDSNGLRNAWLMKTFQPVPVSTFAVAQQWQKYASVADAVAFPYMWNNHQMVQITFPSAFISPLGVKTAATWVYDRTVSDIVGRPCWHERQYLDDLGYLRGRPELFHCFCYGKHLVGSGGADGNPGAIYQYSDSTYTDCGTNYAGAQVLQPFVRDRICPHLWQQNKRIIYNRIELELARGVGTAAPGQGYKPTMMLRWSNDAGNNFGAEHPLNLGQIGNYSMRVYYTRSGYARDRVWWFRCSDPVYAGLVTAEQDYIICSS